MSLGHCAANAVVHFNNHAKSECASTQRHVTASWQRFPLRSIILTVNVYTLSLCIIMVCRLDGQVPTKRNCNGKYCNFVKLLFISTSIKKKLALNELTDIHGMEASPVEHFISYAFAYLRTFSEY